jgi:flagellar protein FliO/FliZ
MELPEIATFAAALLAVLALIMAIAWVLRRFFGGTERAGSAVPRRRDRRLGVVEAAQVGPRHRLLLVRRDDREHLLLIGGTTELVVETDISHPGAEADVRIRPVEPRLAGEPADDRVYRPSDEFEPRPSRSRRALSETEFGSGLAAYPEPDDGPPLARERYTPGEAERDYERDEYVAGRERNPNDDNYDDGEEPRPRSEPPSFESRIRRFEAGSPLFERQDSAEDDYHVVDDEGDERDRDADDDERYTRTIYESDRRSEREPDEGAQSRILSRFLKKDGP